MNGALSIDLTKLPAPYGEAAAGSTDNYALLKLLNWAIVEFIPDVEDSDLAASVSGILGPLMDALGGAMGG